MSKRKSAVLTDSESESDSGSDIDKVKKTYYRVTLKL